MPLDIFPPAPGQGAICIESRIGDSRVDEMLAAINHVPTGQALACERAFLAALDGSCRTPIAGYATVDGEQAGVQRPDPDAGRQAVARDRGGRTCRRCRRNRPRGRRKGARARPATHFFDGWS